MIITDEGFIEIDITADMIRLAQEKANELGQLSNSIRQGRGNLAGFLGEAVVDAAWGGGISSNTYDFDATLEGEKFEIKTKDRTVPPALHYEASVANYNTKQRAGYYVFVSLLRRDTLFTKGYVIGIIPTSDYYKEATFRRVGEIDPSNGWTVRANCYNLPYEKLYRFNSWAVEAA